MARESISRSAVECPNSLNTPRLVADASQNAVWKWDNQEPFGNDSPNQDPGNTGTPFPFNSRFPGQYADAEDNLAYNEFRDYDAGLGRYTRSDPIGLQGGLNAYTYVLASPLSFYDPRGLMGGGGNHATSLFTGLIREISACLCKISVRYCIDPRDIAGGSTGYGGIWPQILGILPAGETSVFGRITISQSIYGKVQKRSDGLDGSPGILDLAQTIAHESLHQTQENWLQRFLPENPAIDDEATYFIDHNRQLIRDCLNCKQK